jgi:hypothetical protein
MKLTLHLNRLAIVLLAGASTAGGATLVWTNTAGGSWNSAGNWSPNQIPVATDQAYITNTGTFTVTIPVNASVDRVTVGGDAGTQTVLQVGGVFTAAQGHIQSNGRFTLQSGTLCGVLTVASGGTLIL